MNSPRRMSSSRWSWLAVAMTSCALVSSTRSLAECEPGFELHPEYYTFSVGAKPVSVATGDWNEDGRPDVVTANADGRSLTLLFGAGGFHLRPGGEIPMGAAAYWVEPKDMNADGHLDLVATGDFGTVVLVGDGRGGFRTGATYPYAGTFLALGDLNRDGSCDIALVSRTAKLDVTFLFLKGLDVDHVHTLPYPVDAIHLGDFNEDGALDMAVVGCGGYIWLNPGDGTFSPTWTFYPYHCCTKWGAVGDINGDGHVDIVGVDSYPGCGGVLLGRGDGTFQDPYGGLAAELPSGPEEPRPPAVARRQVPSGETRHEPWMPPLLSGASWQVQDSGGEPLPERPASVPSSLWPTNEPGAGPDLLLDAVHYGPHWVMLADLDGDGRDDWVTLSNQPGEEVLYRRSVSYPTAAVVVDIDGDGRLDVVAAGRQYWGAGPIDGAVAVHPGDEHDIIRRNPSVYMSDRPVMAELVDFNRDGIADIASMGDDGLQIVLRQADGSLGPILGAPGYYGFGHAFVDINGDGNLDVLDGDPMLYLGNGDGTFDWEMPIQYFDSRLSGFDAGDVDGDGKVDVVGIRWYSVPGNRPEGPALLLRGNGDGTFRPATELGITAAQVRLKDLDGDGHLDMVVARENGGMSVYWGSGDGTFTMGPVLESSGTIYSLLYGDIDGDGRLDLFANPEAREVVYRSLGGRSYQRLALNLRVYPTFPALGDINGDGKDDLIDYGIQAFHVYLSNGDGSFRGPLEDSYGPGGLVLVDRASRSPQQLFALTRNNEYYFTKVTLVENEQRPNRGPITGNARAVVTGPGARNHGWADISIAGVSDPEGDAVSIAVTGITQDEPVGSGFMGGPHGTAGSGGPHCPDALIVGGQARVRWERAGSGNGRMYRVDFIATDGCGGTSPGQVNVCVPHDAASLTCVDDGQRYNSLGCEVGGPAALAVSAADGLYAPQVHAGGAELHYSLAQSAEVRLEIFDLLGRRRAVLTGGLQPPGEHRARWDAVGAAGVYFARLSIRGQSFVQRFALLP